jgi:hypothetical protein
MEIPKVLERLTMDTAESIFNIKPSGIRLPYLQNYLYRSSIPTGLLQAVALKMLLPGAKAGHLSREIL